MSHDPLFTPCRCYVSGRHKVVPLTCKSKGRHQRRNSHFGETISCIRSRLSTCGCWFVALVPIAGINGEPLLFRLRTKRCSFPPQEKFSQQLSILRKCSGCFMISSSSGAILAYISDASRPLPTTICHCIRYGCIRFHQHAHLSVNYALIPVPSIGKGPGIHS